MASIGSVNGIPVAPSFDQKQEDGGRARVARATRAARSMFWPAIWLGVTFVAAKAACMGSPASHGTIATYLWHLLVASASDLLCALVIGLAGQALLWTAGRRPTVQRAAWVLLMGACCVGVFYAVASVRIFAHLGTALTWTIVTLGGDVASMRSSLLAFVTPWLVTALLLIPALYLLAVIWARRSLGEPQTRFSRWTLFFLALAIIGWGIAANHHVRRSGSLQRLRLSANPHYTLLASFVSDRFFGPVEEKLGIEFAPDDASDFRIVAQRPVPPLTTAGLPRGPKNVLVIAMESVGTQFLTPYGSEYDVTPRLAAAAQNALVFDNYYSNYGNSANAMLAMMLSNYPPLRAEEFIRRRPDAPGITAAQVLKQKGYRTAFISSGFNNWANQAEFLANRGYDIVQDGAASGAPPLNSWGVEDRYLVDMLLRYLDQKDQRPFFIFAWTQGTHHPYGPEYGMPAAGWENPDYLKGEKKFEGMTWDLARYLSALHETDREIGRLLSELRRRNLAEDTLVVITGDHGEAFGWPHKVYGHNPGSVHDEFVRVPLMIWNPRLFPQGQRSAVIGGHIDFSPTILDLLGLPPQSPWQGRSLFADLRPARTYFFGSADQGHIGLREGKWKYSYNRLIKSDELFDLSIDPLEQTNLAANHPQLCQRLRQRLSAWSHYQLELMK